MGRLRTILIVLIVLILVIVGVVFLLPMLTAPQTPATVQATTVPGLPIVEEPEETPLPTPDLVQVIIALQDLPRGFVITRDAIELRDWPRSALPFNAVPVEEIDEIVGQIARTDIYREQPLLRSMLVEDLTSLARVGSDAAAVLPSGLVAIAVPMDRLTSVAYGVQDGDSVDIILSMLFVDVDEEFQSLLPNRVTLISQDPESGELILTTAIEGRIDPLGFANAVIGPSERQRPRLVTQRTIQDALVLHVGEFPPDGRFIGVPPTPTASAEQAEDGGGEATPVPTPTETRPDIVTLGVTPQDAVVLTYFIEVRLPITFVLRSVRDTSRVPTDPVTLDYIMTEFNIQLPGRRPYSIEPAIRSIRQLVIENQVNLETAGGGGG
jgi:pilus assembly protein CpaB